METIFIYFLKVNALLVLFYLVYQVALSRETFYKHSRIFLLSGLFISLLLPLITFTKIEYYEVKRVLNNSIENNVPQMVQISNEVAQEPILTNQEILFLVYGIICFGFLIKTLFDFFKLFKIITVSNSEKKDKLVYINTNLVHTPFSFFNYIVFNEELINPVELQNIMKHEEAHSMQKHSFDTLLAQFFIILFWFNPMVWLYRKSIVQNLEFLADSYAIQQVSDKKHYQKTMLKITTQSSNITIINTFNQSSIKKRIIMLNTNQSNKKNIWKYVLVLPLLTAFMLLFQVETIAQEKIIKDVKTLNSETSTFSSILSKNTTDEEIEELEKAFSDENQKLKITNILRNQNNEITSIKLSFDTGKTYNEVFERKGTDPILDVKIFVNTDKNKNIDCGFAEIDNKVSEKEIIEIKKLQPNKSSEFWYIDNMTKNGKEVVLVINGEVNKSNQRVKIPIDEELGEMKEITPTQFENKYKKNADSNQYYYEVATVRSLPNNENIKIEIENVRKEMPYVPVIDIDFPTPPDAPNMPDAPVPPTNPNDKKAWKKFEKEMWLFGQKMKSLEPKMKKFEQEMKVFEGKVIENSNTNSKASNYEVKYSKSNQSDQIDNIKKGKNVDAKKALIIFNDNEINYKELDNINPNIIASVSVISATQFALKKYGDKAKNGVIIIESKEYFEKKSKN